MDKKVYKWNSREKNEIKRITRDYLDILNLDSWTTYHTFVDGQIKGERMKDGSIFLSDAYSTVTQEYEKVVLEWHPPLLKAMRDGDDEQILETISHELVHCLTDELSSLATNRYASEDQIRKATERLTQRFAKIVCTKIQIKKK